MPKKKSARRRSSDPFENGDFEREFERIRRETSKFPTAFVAVFLTVGLLALAAALITGTFALRKSLRQQALPGQVVETIDRRQASGSGYDRFFNYPVVAFEVGDQMRRVELPTGYAPPRYAPGDHVTILYDPANPNAISIRDESSALLLWLVPGITGLLGTVFTAIGVLVIWLHLRESRAEPASE